MLFIGAAAAETRDGKQNSDVNERLFCSYVASLLPELRALHRPACEKLPFIFDDFLPSEISQIRRFSLQEKKT